MGAERNKLQVSHVKDSAIYSLIVYANYLQDTKMGTFFLKATNKRAKICLHERGMCTQIYQILG